MSHDDDDDDDDGRSLEGLWIGVISDKDIGQNSKTTNQPAAATSTCVVQPWATVAP